MGAEYQEQWTLRKGGAIEQFRDLVEEDQYEHGHQGYTGTISTTNLTKIIPYTELPRPSSKAWEEAVELLRNQVPKWETWAIQLSPAYVKKHKTPRLRDKRNVNGYIFMSLCSC